MSAPEIRDAIEKITKVVSEQPQKARSKGSATATLETGLRFQVTGLNAEAAFTDMPPSVGGKGSAPNPGWLLRASLGILQCYSDRHACRPTRHRAEDIRGHGHQ